MANLDVTTSGAHLAQGLVTPEGGGADKTLATIAAQAHAAVTVAGTPDYVTLSGQQLTLNAVDLTADVTGALPIANGGTGAATAANAFTAIKQAATESATGVVELATNAEVATGTDTTRAVTPAGAASRYQPLDAELTAWAGLTSAADTLGYFTGAGAAATTTLSSFGRSLIDDADAAAARTTLGLGAVYAPLRYTIVTETGTTRTNAATDATAFVEWTSTSAKTFTVNTAVATAGDVWNGANTGTNALTIAAGTSPGTMTLVGSLVFATGKAYSIVFITNSRAIVIGGA